MSDLGKGRAEWQYMADMGAAAEMLRIKLSMIQCADSVRVRNMLEDEIMVEYVSTVVAIWHAYAVKATVLYGFARGVNETGH